MAKHRTEEGSNSDSSSGSLKEITADDFKQQDARVSSRSRVWMNDLMRYPVHRNYGQDLYSFAWAQAVQNKPLGIDVKDDDDDDDDIEMYVAEEREEEEEGEKEEGELEEGEIGFGAEIVNLESNEEEKVEEKGEREEESEEKVEEIGEFDKRFGAILEELDTITEDEAQSSFEEVCSRLQKSFASLKQMFAEGHVPILDVLVQQAFMGIQTVYSAFSSGNKMDQNKDKELLLRLLIHIKNQYSGFLSAEQVKEIDVKVHALASEAISTGKTTSNGKASLSNLELPVTSRSRVDFSPLLNLHADYDEDSLPSPTRDNAPPLPMSKPIGFVSGEVAPAKPKPTKNVDAENGTFHPYVTDAFKAVSSYQQKYGKNSVLARNRLPSPTPSDDGNGGDDDIHGEVSSSVAGNVRTVEPCSTAANTSSIPRPQMAPINTTTGFQVAPSSLGRQQMAPVSSSGSFPLASYNSSGGPQMAPVSNIGSFPMAPVNSYVGPQTAYVKTVGQGGFEPKLAIKASAKSRDPRLRFMNPEVGVASQNGFIGSVSSRKNKAVDEHVPDEHTLKRQRIGSTSSTDVQMTAGRGGWIEEHGVAASQINNRVQINQNVAVGNRNLIGGEVGSDRRVNVNNSFNASNGSQDMSASSAPVVSLPSLLKDIAVNPTMLVQLVKMEQQRLAAAEAQQKAAGPAVTALSNVVSSSSEDGRNPAAKPQMTPQTNSMNDAAKYMKPRDPRRVLHNMVQQSKISGAEPVKTSANSSSDIQSNKDRLIVGEQGEQAQTTALSSQSASLPDISRQFTKNLQNVAEIVSTSQASSSPAGTQVQSGPNNDSIELKAEPGSRDQGDTTDGVSQSANPWGDVDHLLDGYDDLQKAAIQKERARRIEEQNKMFAARKLCLVLDLDHTLLNSAKFVEVDPIHEEILRKKEEQDKQKQERHLFRFPHMGMWTKLRPGVWKFLEKASQLYELHLYTMGNKLYATEMAKVLDPKGTLFSGRVISKGDDGDPFDGDERVPKSKDLDGVLGMESAVVIIDDSVRVWPHNKLNLIVVERYTYFPSSRRQFGLHGPSLLEIDHDERPEAGTLASSLAVIERIHQDFFSHQSLNEVDVRRILADTQRKILAGCKIVFSRVFPVGEANPHLHPLWQTAEQFGAECTNQIDEQVTHVVANSLGTDKVNWALSTGRFVVHPGWVEASALLYRRANEQDFAVKI